MRVFAAAVAVAVAGLSSTAHAAITVYTSQAAFDAAVGTIGVDTFQSLSNSKETPSPITRTAGTFGYTAVSTTTFFGAGPDADHWLSTNTATDTITFNAFTGGVSALGGLFFGTDVFGDFELGSVTLTATDADGTVSQTISGATTSSFLGFVSTGALLSATLAAVQPTDNVLWPTANNLRLASPAVTAPVPEPATWAMMIGGFGLAGGRMRRRRAVRTSVNFA